MRLYGLEGRSTRWLIIKTIAIDGDRVGCSLFFAIGVRVVDGDDRTRLYRCRRHLRHLCYRRHCCCCVLLLSIVVVNGGGPRWVGEASWYCLCAGRKVSSSSIIGVGVFEVAVDIVAAIRSSFLPF